MDKNTDHPVSQPLRSLLGLYEEHLAEVRFADMDLGVLAAQIDVVEAKAETLRQAMARVQEAQAGLLASQEDLDKAGQKALAYASVFAADQPDLQKALAALPGLRATASTRSNKKARQPRKAKAIEDTAPPSSPQPTGGASVNDNPDGGHASAMA